MKKTLCVLLLFSSSSCFAVNHEIGLRIGGGTITNDDRADGGFAFQLGYNYLLNPHFALDTAYYGNTGGLGYIGSLGLVDEVSSVGGGLLGVKAQYPVFKYLNVFAKGGLNYSSVEVTTELRKDKTDSTTYSGVHPYYGAGTELMLGNHVGISIEYQRIELSHNFSSDNWLTGINLKF